MTNLKGWQFSGGVCFLVLFGCSSNEPQPAAASAGSEVAPETAAPVAAPAPAEPATAAEAAPAITPVDPATAPQNVPITVSKQAKAVVDAKDRSEADRALDAGRHPGELLTFFEVKPGMKVAELFAGGGYTAELLARAVGKQGKVYGQNSKLILERFAAAPWAERLAKPVNKNVVRVDQELEEPLPAQAKDLDIVFLVLAYHDSVWLGTDRSKMNAAIFAALKPGGVYAVVDHSSRTGSGTTEVQTMHRIEESVVRAEIEQAGFKLESESGFLRDPADTRDWNDSPMAAADRRGTSDRFVLKFTKPK